MSGIIGHLGTKSGLINSSKNLGDDGVMVIGNLRLQKITGTSGGAASHASGQGNAQYYIQLAVNFSYTYPVAPMTFWHWGSFDSHQPVIAATNTSTTAATAYAHSYTETNVESKAFYVLVIGEVS